MTGTEESVRSFDKQWVFRSLRSNLNKPGQKHVNGATVPLSENLLVMTLVNMLIFKMKVIIRIEEGNIKQCQYSIQNNW